MSHVIIDKTKCKACYLCVDVCPKKLIKKSKEANSMGHFPVEFEDKDDQCLGCALCAIRCPDLAIVEVIKSEK